jgi:hypothetical protein
MRRMLLASVFVLAVAASAAGQITVYDPAVTARNTVTAILKESLVRTQTAQRQQIDRMARRLSLLTNLRKFSLPEAPEWRIHDFWDEGISPLARDYHAALNYGDRLGRAFLAVSHPVAPTAGLLGRLPQRALQAFSARLATLDVADAVAVAATHDAGATRFNGRRELAAIEALEGHVVDPSDQQSATAVLEKVSGAELIGNRQRQARVQLLGGLLEQLLTDNKRVRDADAASMNMQLTTWRDGAAANEAFVAGSGDALRTWRQP